MCEACADKMGPFNIPSFGFCHNFRNKENLKKRITSCQESRTNLPKSFKSNISKTIRGKWQISSLRTW